MKTGGGDAPPVGHASVRWRTHGAQNPYITPCLLLNHVFTPDDDARTRKQRKIAGPEREGARPPFDGPSGPSGTGDTIYREPCAGEN